MIPESLILAFITVKAKGGSFNREEDIFKYWYLAIGASAIYWVTLLLIQKGSKAGSMILPYFPYIHVGLYFFLIAAVLLSRDNFGSYVLAGGMFLNMIPLAANGRMPVSLTAELATGREAGIRMLLENRSLVHMAAGENTRFNILSDIIPLPPPYYQPKVVSIGDILIAVGLYLMLVLYGTKGRAE